MKIIVTDTNIFIDLIRSNAISLFFQCPFEICTTDLVLSELSAPGQRESLEPFIYTQKLHVFELESHEIEAAFKLQTSHVLKGLTDKSVLLKAMELNCCIVSGDGNLRKSAENKNLEVRGTLWILREIWQNKLESIENLLEILDVLAQKARLPQKELEKLRLEIRGDT
jgi:predicted nucleic acid-binding protein